MAPATVHLPNGQTLLVQPVFGGLSFKSPDLHTSHSVFPPGWTIILNSEDDEDDHHPPTASMAAHTQNVHAENDPNRPSTPMRKHHIHRFRKPSLQNDHMFISSISNPNSSDFKPSSSPTRSIAMMLWATLWWYFHQPEPAPYLTTAASAETPLEGRPKGEWKVYINREGIFKGKHLLPKLERMGLIASEDSTVGLDPEDGVGNAGEGWTHMFVSRKSFWQMDPRIYLFTLTPTAASSPYPSVSPAHSRPASPNRGGASTPTMSMTARGGDDSAIAALGAVPPNPLSRHNTPPGPYTSSSHLPTFYPPPPLLYTFTNGIRHPVRPKPPRQGETFYTRYIPSLGQYLSFRVASLSRNPCLHRGPTTSSPGMSEVRFSRGIASSDTSIPTVAGLNLDDRLQQDPLSTMLMTDTDLLHKWMNDPRVAYSWGETGPSSHQSEFLQSGLTSRHSFPAIGCFDGKPFGYFEVYWVKEDRLSRLVGDKEIGDWDRGLHCLVGEQEFRGEHRVKVWLSALVHYCWLADMRTERVVMEPRVDNDK
jgi:RimJ/RimL family protein N-acetyltransferase